MTDNRQTVLVICVVVALFIASVPISIGVFNVRFDYTMIIVAIGGATLGTISGVLGSFAVLRQQSLLGDALSHAALPGVAIAFLFAGRELGVLLIGAGIAGLIAIQMIQSITTTTRIKQDAAMGMILAAFFAIGIALLSYIQNRADASQAGLDSFIFGQAAAIRQSDIVTILIVGVISFIVLALLWKEFKLITFDAEFANANGFRVMVIDSILSLLIVVAIVLGLQLAGVILMVGMLIAPGVAARQWTNQLGNMVFMAAVFGAFAGGLGAIASGIDQGIPTGPLIIVIAVMMVTMSILFAPQRGVIHQWLQARHNRHKFSEQNVLIDLYKHAQQHDNLQAPTPENLIVNLWGKTGLKALKQLQNRKWVQSNQGEWQLTETGIKEAKKLEHNELLWNLYRQYGEELELPIIQEDRSRSIRELMPIEAIQKLETLRPGVQR